MDRDNLPAPSSPLSLPSCWPAQQEIKLGSIHPTRDFNYVKDTLDGFIAIAETQATIGEEIKHCLATGDFHRQLAREIIEQINPAARIISEDIRIRPEKSEVERAAGQ